MTGSSRSSISRSSIHTGIENDNEGYNPQDSEKQLGAVTSDADEEDKTPQCDKKAEQKRHAHSQADQFTSPADKEQIIVQWDGDSDPENPKTWSAPYKWYLTIISSILILNSTFTSSAPSGILSSMREELNMSEEVGTLTIAIFVAAYCVGPLLWGPVSERIGRLPCFNIGLFAYTCFNIGCALAPNTGAMLAFRFLGGVFASSPLTTAAGVIADLWDAKTRGTAMAFFSLAPFAGPVLGPIISGAITVRGVDWRILFWVCTAFSGACFLITVLTVRETYAPAILLRKAKRLRKETGDSKYVAPLETKQLQPSQLLKETLLKPFILLATEPMLLAVTLVMSYVYGLFYLLFEAYPIIYIETYHFNILEEGLAFIPLFVGGFIAVLWCLFIENPRYARMMQQAKGRKVPPEQRLILLMIAIPGMTVTFFWQGWTAYPSISYWAPLLSGVLLGFSVLFMFTAIFSYVVDTLLPVAASATSALTVCRSIFGAAFPMFAGAMYKRLGVQWTSTLLGCLSLLMIPVPFVLFRYGATLRAKSRYALSD